MNGIGLKEIQENKANENIIPKFARNLKPSITFKEADKPITRYLNLKNSLDGTSEGERKIYKVAKLEKGVINGREVLQRSDINFNLKDNFDRSNLDRMKLGRAPLKDGKPIELHHIGQHMNSPLAELIWSEHRGQGNDTILHNKQKESEIDRNVFNKEKQDYWKARANTYLVAS